MKEPNLLSRLDRVQAPPGFEQRVLAALRERKAAASAVRSRAYGWRLSLAGAFAALLVCFMLINVFVLQRNGAAGQAGLEKDLGTEEVVHLMESVNYGLEVRSISAESGTVYLLEQVSETSNSSVIY